MSALHLFLIIVPNVFSSKIAICGRGEGLTLLVKWNKLTVKCSEVGRSGKFLVNDMFIGEYTHSIDTKKRLSLPSKVRGELGDRVVVTRGLDACLFVYPMKTWEVLAEKLGSMPIGESGMRSFVRLMLAGAIDVEVDSQGRILLPEYLKEYAGLSKDVVIAGLWNRLEVWDESKWAVYKKEAEGNTERIAEELGKIGIY